MTQTVTADEITKESINAPKVVVRRFQPGDEADFRRLNEEWIVRYFVLEDIDRQVLCDPATHILAPGGQIVLAIVNGLTVGCCALVPEGHGVYELAKMAVTESYRGLGIGRKLLKFAIAEARKMGAVKLELETNSTLPAASKLYESVGFQHVTPDQRRASLYSRADVFMDLVL